jgi:hypothetical protein
VSDQERGSTPAGAGLPAAPSAGPDQRDPLAPAAATVAPDLPRRDSVEELGDLIVSQAGPPIDIWAIAALLESNGLRDLDAAQRYGREDVFALAQAVQVRLPDAEPRRPEPDEPPLTPRKRLERYARIYGRGTFFFIPLALQLVALLAVGVSQYAAIHFTNTQASVVAVAAALSFVVTAGFVQSLGYLAPLYIETGKHMLAESVAWTILGVGAIAAALLGGVLWAICAATHAYPADELRIMAAYYALLSAQGLVSALLYMLKRFLLIVIATVASLALAAVLYKHSSLAIEQVHWASLALGVAMELGCATFILHRRAVNTKGDMRLAKLPRWRLQTRRAFPFGLYGLVYFTFLTADRVVAWASGSHPLPLWFRTPYELALDLALGGILFALAFLEVTVEDFSAMLVPTAERFSIVSLREFNRTLSRFWAKQIAYVAGLAALGTWLAVVLAVGLHKLHALGPAGKIYRDPVAHEVFGIGILAYAFLAIGIANCVFLQSLNKPWRAIASMGPGLALSVLVGVALTAHHSYWTAVFGMLAGAVVFAGLSAWQAWRTLRRADYYNYSAW